MAYSFGLDWAEAVADPLSAHEKMAIPESSGAESGIESSSSSSSLDEPCKNNSLGKLVVTATTRLKAQVPSSQMLSIPARPDLSSPMEIAVIYRGKLPLPNPVPATDKMARMQLMKMNAKKVQHDPNCTFAVMHIDEQYIKLYSMDEPRTLLFEIECKKLDLVKLSRKDISFFYFTTYTPVETNIGRVESPADKEANNSRYMSYIFHGTSPKMAERAFKLIKNFIDNKPPYPQSILQVGTPRASLQSCSASKPQTPSDCVQVSPTNESTNANQEENSCQSLNLLLNISDSHQSDDVLDLFDSLSAPQVSQPTPVPANKQVDLLSDLLSPPVAVKQESSFVAQHLNYSMQMSASYNTGQACVNSMPMQCNPVNPFANNVVASANLAPSFMPPMQPQATFVNPFQVAPVMAPPAQPCSSLPAPMKPVPNPISSMHGLTQPPSISNTNPFSGMTNRNAICPGSQAQLLALGSNPFKASPAHRQSSGSSRMSFGSDFDDFLSQTIKGQLSNKS